MCVGESWWTFEPRDSEYLNVDGKRLKTYSATLYYYVDTTDKFYLDFNGEHRRYVDGDFHEMKKVTHDSGDVFVLKHTCD